MKPASHERQTRTTKTKGRIKAALTELIREKGLDALTVSDVARRAGINRGTFYLHFVDKYDLLEQLEDEIIQGLTDILLNRDKDVSASSLSEIFPYDAILKALDYVSDDLDFVTAIAGEGGDEQFTSKVKGVIENLFDQGLRRTGGKIDGDETYPRAYAREIALSYTMSIINLWLSRGCSEPTAQVARMICGSSQLAPSSFVS